MSNNLSYNQLKALQPGPGPYPLFTKASLLREKYGAEARELKLNSTLAKSLGQLPGHFFSDEISSLSDAQARYRVIELEGLFKPAKKYFKEIAKISNLSRKYFDSKLGEQYSLLQRKVDAAISACKKAEPGTKSLGKSSLATVKDSWRKWNLLLYKVLGAASNNNEQTRAELFEQAKYLAFNSQSRIDASSSNFKQSLEKSIAGRIQIRNSGSTRTRKYPKIETEDQARKYLERFKDQAIKLGSVFQFLHAIDIQRSSNNLGKLSQEEKSLLKYLYENSQKFLNYKIPEGLKALKNNFVENHIALANRALDFENSFKDLFWAYSQDNTIIQDEVLEAFRDLVIKPKPYDELLAEIMSVTVQEEHKKIKILTELNPDDINPKNNTFEQIYRDALIGLFPLFKLESTPNSIVMKYICAFQDSIKCLQSCEASRFRDEYDHLFKLILRSQDEVLKSRNNSPSYNPFDAYEANPDEILGPVKEKPIKQVEKPSTLRKLAKAGLAGSAVLAMLTLGASETSEDTSKDKRRETVNPDNEKIDKTQVENKKIPEPKAKKLDEPINAKPEAKVLDKEAAKPKAAPGPKPVAAKKTSNIKLQIDKEFFKKNPVGSEFLVLREKNGDKEFFHVGLELEVLKNAVLSEDGVARFKDNWSYVGTLPAYLFVDASDEKVESLVKDLQEVDKKVMKAVEARDKYVPLVVDRKTKYGDKSNFSASKVVLLIEDLDSVSGLRYLACHLPKNVLWDYASKSFKRDGESYNGLIEVRLPGEKPVTAFVPADRVAFLQGFSG